VRFDGVTVAPGERVSRELPPPPPAPAGRMEPPDQVEPEG
jgi:hypothetical protein